MAATTLARETKLVHRLTLGCLGRSLRKIRNILVGNTRPLAVALDRGLVRVPLPGKNVVARDTSDRDKHCTILSPNKLLIPFSTP